VRVVTGTRNVADARKTFLAQRFQTLPRLMKRSFLIYVAILALSGAVVLLAIQ
jgi:hypothetical protein